MRQVSEADQSERWRPMATLNGVSATIVIVIGSLVVAIIEKTLLRTAQAG